MSRTESLPRLIAAHGVGGWVGRREVEAGIQCKVPKRDRTGLLLVPSRVHRPGPSVPLFRLVVFLLCQSLSLGVPRRFYTAPRVRECCLWRRPVQTFKGQ